MNTYTHTDNPIDIKEYSLEVVGGVFSNIEDYLKKFKVHYPKSLFQPTPAELKYYIGKQHCPICFHKLYWNRDKTILRCKSKRKDKFFVRKEVFEKLST
jgi:hypothetical protein